MTFADYELTAGSTIYEHFHPEEEAYEVIAGELEMTVDGTDSPQHSDGCSRVASSHHARTRMPAQVSHFDGSPGGTSTSNHTCPG
jgi:oxalate decarboxylase/phosphoglucose isomerase-like protein (cupin superfamily)